MANPDESIFKASMRAFFIATFKMTGFAVGVLLFFFFLSTLSSYEEPDSEKDYEVSLIANADDERKKFSSSRDTILQLNIVGEIGLGELNMEKVRRILMESREGDLKNNLIKGVLVYINTPGGTVIDADGIWQALIEYKTRYKVPIYAYVDGLCASGGMYVAAACDKVYASDTSLVGSVGVIATFMNVSDTLDKIGVKTLTLAYGKDKDAMNPLRPWKPDEAKNYEKLIDFYYNKFIDIVTTGRKELSKEKLINEYGAQVFAAPLAKEYGYIDASGKTRGDTLKDLQKEAGLEEKEIQVVTMAKLKWLQSILTSKFLNWDGSVNHKLDLGNKESALASKNTFLYYYKQ